MPSHTPRRAEPHRNSPTIIPRRGAAVGAVGQSRSAPQSGGESRREDRLYTLGEGGEESGACRQAALRSHSTPSTEQLRPELPLFSWIPFGIHRLRLIVSCHRRIHRPSRIPRDRAPEYFRNVSVSVCFRFVICANTSAVLCSDWLNKCKTKWLSSRKAVC